MSAIGTEKASTILSNGVSPPAKSTLPEAAGWSTIVDSGNAVSLVNATVPVLLGKVSVLSAVGSVTCKVVSKLSAVEPSNTMLPPTVKLVMLGLASKAIEISLFETVVVILLPPVKFNVSVASATASSDPLSAPTVKLVVIEAVDMAVIKPLPFTVTIGIAVELPKAPVFEFTVASVNAPDVATVASPLM